MNYYTLDTTPRGLFLVSLLVFSSCCAPGEAKSWEVKRMDKFTIDRFVKDFFRKKPVVIRKANEYLQNSSTDLFRLCGRSQVSLSRLPDMERDMDTISLNDAVYPCGPDCYGVSQEPLCKEFLDTLGNVSLPEGHSISDLSSTYVNVGKAGMETPARQTDRHHFRYLSAGLEEWRLLTHFDGVLDLFSQDYHQLTLAPGELLYLPPRTVAQHKAITQLTIAIGGLRETAESVENVQVETMDGGILQ